MNESPAVVRRDSVRSASGVKGTADTAVAPKQHC